MRASCTVIFGVVDDAMIGRGGHVGAFYVSSEWYLLVGDKTTRGRHA